MLRSVLNVVDTSGDGRIQYDGKPTFPNVARSWFCHQPNDR